MGSPIYDGIKSGCMGKDGVNQCYSLCSKNRRYCATDPDDDLDKGISGADIVEISSSKSTRLRLTVLCPLCPGRMIPGSKISGRLVAPMTKSVLFPNSYLQLLDFKL